MKSSSFLTIMLVICSYVSKAQVSGTVFRDFNGNSTREASAPIEPGLGGITVSAYDSVNVLIATATSSAVTATLGAYSFSAAQIPAGKSVRIQFSGLAAADKQAFASATTNASGSSVRFITAGASAVVNYAVSYPNWYSSTTDPYIATSRYTAGDATALAAGQSGTFLNLMVLKHSSAADETATTLSAANRYTGAVFGLAYQKQTRTLFEAAYLKRHNGFGPNGIGAIYKSVVSAAGAPATPSLFVDVSTIGINVGTDPHGTLPATPTGTGADAASWPLVGKRGIGNISLSDDGKYMYLVNMNPTGAPALPTLNRIFINNPAVTPTSANVTSWPIPTPTLTGAATSFRPMAVKYWRGRIFVGGVCVKEITANQSAADTAGMKAIIYEFNETAGTFTTVLSIPLTNKRPYLDNNNDMEYRAHYWGPWQNSLVTTQILFDAIGGAVTRPAPYGPEPMVSDIEFDVNGDMMVGMRDRWGDQMGWGNVMPDGTGSYNGISSAEIYRAGNCSGTFTLENNGTLCNGLSSGGANLPGYSGYTANVNKVGPGGGLYYFDVNPPTFNHQFRSNGGLAMLAGSNVLTFTAMDPQSAFNTGGVMHVYNSTAGANAAGTIRGGSGGGALLFTTGTGGPGKAAGMGDIELLTDAEPIQIGNRIWNDANGNGIQDANETGLAVPAGTLVTLRSPGPDGNYATTGDNQSWTTTTNADGSYYFSALASADTRKPALWTGVGNTVLPGYAYRIEMTIPSGYLLSKTDASSNAYDNIDNDAAQNGAIAYIDINTSDINHSYDFGFKPLGAIGDRVWLDNGTGGGTAGNGLQDGTEPGVAGITVTLYNSAGTPIATTTTDAYGNYLFENVVPGTYTAGFTLPANYRFSTQTNTTDDNNTTGTSTTGSDVNPVTGRTYSIVISAGESNLNIDAGLTFNAATVTQSLGNTVWLDNGLGGGTAANGIQDGTEPGVSGVTVTLYNAAGTVILGSTTTDAAGKYLFNNIATGTYVAGFSLPAGMRFSPKGVLATDLNSDVNLTGASAGKTDVITIAAGNNLTYVDAGIYPIATTAASLGDRVWNDLNHDGVQNTGEPGISGITVNLYASNGTTLIATTVTDANGYYMFTNLAAAIYIVEFVKPAAYTFSPVTAAGANLYTNSDANIATGKTAPINLVAGDRNATIDGGMYVTAPAGTLSLGDKVFNDLNRDGIQDANEPGVPGIAATLYKNGPDGLAGTTDDVLAGTAFTDANGNYYFTDLAASTGTTTYYNVQFSNLPAGYAFTVTGAGTAATDNNANGLGRTAAINLTATDLTIDAGIYQGAQVGKASLGNRVFQDLNGNGVQDTGEPGTGGVTVTLQKDVNGDGVISGAGETAFAAATTNALGIYLFTNLDAGLYAVQFSNMPVGYVISPKDAAAGTDDTDSDGSNAGTTIIAATVSVTGNYNLAEGEDNFSVDLGVIPPASTNTIGDFVWFDKNGDGIQDATEPGVAGVAVTLYSSTGTPLAYTVTGNSGTYLFAGLANGTYSVGFTNLPAGFALTAKSATNDATGSDADPINANTPTVTLNYAAGGQSRNNTTLDAGLISTRGSIGNYVWLDANGDGVQDATEKGIAGVTVTLYASDGTTVLASAVTNTNGSYHFPNLTAGSYVIGFSTIPDGLEFTAQVSSADNGNDTNSDAAPGTGKTFVITLSAGETDLTIDAGLRPTQTAAVGDYVWSDLNADGIQGANEPGIGGIVVTLYNSLNVPLGSAVTDANGKYLITNVTPGTGYYVIFGNTPTNPAGSSQQPSFTAQGANAGTNTSHADAAGKSNTFTVLKGDNITNIDAGIKNYPIALVVAVKDLNVAAVLHGSVATISWITQNEVNTAKFIVERSTDNRTFTEAGDRAAAGNYAGSLNYTLDDNVSNISATVIYYRIKELDLDGKISYSKVAAVRMSGVKDVHVWPSPFTDKINIALISDINQTVNAQIADAAGRIVRSASYKLVKGNNQVSLGNLENLARENYVLKITAENGTVLSAQSIIKN